MFDVCRWIIPACACVYRYPVEPGISKGGDPSEFLKKNPAPYPSQNVDKHIVEFCLRDIVCHTNMDLTWFDSKAESVGRKQCSASTMRKKRQFKNDKTMAKTCETRGYRTVSVAYDRGS